MVRVVRVVKDDKGVSLYKCVCVCVSACVCARMYLFLMTGWPIIIT